MTALPPAARYAVVAADLARIADCATLNGAEVAALDMGDGSHVIDTQSQPYLPAVHVVEAGRLVLAGHGSFDRALGVDANLIEAARRRLPHAIKAFLARGARPDALDVQGATALHWAAAGGDARSAALLLAAGARPGIADSHANTPLDLARTRGHAAVVELLKT